MNNDGALKHQKPLLTINQNRFSQTHLSYCRNKNNGFGTPLSEINQAKYQIVTVKNTAIATESQSISGFTSSSCARFRHAKMTTNVVVIPKNNTGN